MSPEEKREDDIFAVEDVEEAPAPQEFKRPKWLLDLEKKKEGDAIELKSGAAGGKPPPLSPGQTQSRPPPADTERPAPKPRPHASTPSAAPEIRTGKPTAKADPKALAALSSAIEQAEIRKHKAEPPAQLPKIDVPDEFHVKQDQTKAARPALQPLEGPVEVVKPQPDSRPRTAPVPQMEGELQIVKDAHAKTPQSERLKVTKPRKLVGVVDTTFARINMGDAAEDELRKLAGEYDVVRRTVPGIKDLAVECKILLEEEDCDIVVACGMVGAQPIDKQCAHEASMAIQWAMLATNRHILEVFVHEDESKDERQLAWLMERRTREHAINAHWMVQDPRKLRELAGQGLRQGFDDAGPIPRA